MQHSELTVEHETVRITISSQACKTSNIMSMLKLNNL